MDNDTDDMRCYAALRVVGSVDQRFDPADLSRFTGIGATESWRLGDAHGTIAGKTRKFDFWESESSLGRSADLNRQIESFFTSSDVWPRLVEALKPLDPELQLVVHTGRYATEFTIGRETVEKLLQLGAEIDCDLYWVCKPHLEDGQCANCGIAVPSSARGLQYYIGGQQRAAEFQAKFAVYEIAVEEAIRLFDFDADDLSLRIGGNFEICYLPTLGCLQFSTDFLPTSDIPSLEPETWAKAFMSTLVPHLVAVPLENRECILNLVERGDFQGTVGLHFDSAFLKQIADVRASLTIRLRYYPEPHFLPNGECFHCSIDALSKPLE